MRQQDTIIRGTRRAGRLVGLLVVSGLPLLFLLAPIHAQETVVRIEIEGPSEPIPAGEEFEARVVVENVEHLAGFDFTIKYDPKRVEPVEEESSGGAPAAPEGSIYVQVLDAGEFLTSKGERQDMICQDSVADLGENAVTVSCNTLGPPLCLDGQPGASGSGLLGRVVFRSKGGESTTLELTRSTLALDDLEPCDPEQGRVQQVQHRREDASVELIGGGGGGVSWAVVGAGVAVGALVLIGAGLAGFAWYRRRGAGTPA